VVNLGILWMSLSSSVISTVGVLVLTVDGLEGSLPGTAEVCRIGILVLLHRRCQQILVRAEVMRTSSH